MGLVEKAVMAAGETSGGRGGDADKKARMEAEIAALEHGFPPTEPMRCSNVPEERRVRIDFNALRENGMFSPLRKRTRLGMELRALKRKLLGRIGYFKAPRLGASKARQIETSVLVTSTRPGEGKTFLSLNLALSLAFEDNTPVLLVDADLNRPKVAAQLGLPPSEGVADLLTDDALRIEDCVFRAEGAPLHILQSGLAAGDPAELFGSEKAQTLLRDLKKRYAECIVVIDAPPVLAATEAILIAREVDEILFVVQANETRAPMLETALEELAEARERVNFVLNFCAINKSASHYGSYYEYAATDHGAGADSDA
ncbi:MAG: AAA family ATPase [Pseudomonadota bacterium]